jgi:hypothetical protein
MKFRALKDLPQGQKPGEVFEPDTDDMGDVLVSIGAAERVVDPASADPPPDAKGKAKGKYARRDLRAEE